MGDGWRLDFSPTHFDTYSPPDFYTKVSRVTFCFCWLNDTFWSIVGISCYVHFKKSLWKSAYLLFTNTAGLTIY